jgi:hypothetical protein
MRLGGFKEAHVSVLIAEIESGSTVESLWQLATSKSWRPRERPMVGHEQ